MRVTADGKAFAELRPFDAPAAGTAIPTLDLEISIDFAEAAIGRQTSSLRLTPENFREAVAPARTFALASDISHLRELGLAKGGSLDNAIVVDGARVLNPGGLRMKNEFVLHKLLGRGGETSLGLGSALHGRFIANRPGHSPEQQAAEGFRSREGRVGRYHARAPRPKPPQRKRPRHDQSVIFAPRAERDMRSDECFSTSPQYEPGSLALSQSVAAFLRRRATPRRLRWPRTR